MQEHWFSLRKISGQWWNFNSLLPAPQQLSQFYLSAYLATLRDQGYSIFVVHGGLPTYPDTTVAGDQGAWLTEAQVVAPPSVSWMPWLVGRRESSQQKPESSLYLALIMLAAKR